MMLSIKLRDDGRYDSSMSILPLLHVQMIKTAVVDADHNSTMSAFKFRKSLLVNVKRQELEEAAAKDFLDIEAVNAKEAAQQQSEKVGSSVIAYCEDLDKLIIGEFGTLEAKLDKTGCSTTSGCGSEPGAASLSRSS